MNAARLKNPETASPGVPPATPRPGDLWVPDEPVPPGGWSPAPGAVPCVVSEWVRRPGRGGVLETKPVHTWLRRAAASLEADDWGIERARRFARAWTLLNAARREAPDGTVGLCGACVRRLVRAGVCRRQLPGDAARG